MTEAPTALRLATGIQPAAEPVPPPIPLTVTRRVAVRITGLDIPGSFRIAAGRRLRPIVLGVGALDGAPDQLFTSGTRAIIETYVDVTRDDGVETLAGPYLVGEPHLRAVLVQWGTVSRGGHFQLYTGLQLRLPALASHGRAGQLSHARVVLTASIVLRDGQGNPRTGIAEAADVHWRLRSDASRTTAGRRDARLALIR